MKRLGLHLLTLCFVWPIIYFNVPVAFAAGTLNVDKKFAEVDHWVIGYSESLDGCVAAVPFRDKTTLWIGFSQNDDGRGSFIALTNPNWQSIQTEGIYDLRFRTDRTSWRGKFIGFVRTNERGIFAVGVKDAFLDAVADASGIAVYLNNKIVTKLSLEGSSGALQVTARCEKHFLAARGSDKSEKGNEYSGTGFFVSTAGHVLTNNHVIEACSNIDVRMVGVAPSPASVAARDKVNDLAIIETSIQPPGFPAFRSQVRVGESVAVFGFPLGDILSSAGNFTVGIVAAITGLADDSRMVQISAPVQPGNSGGPVLDKSGNVVGLVVSKLNALNVAAATKDIPQNVNFAIKSSAAVNFLNSNGIEAEQELRNSELPTESIAEVAKTFTVKITCR
jgi:serine protease Do